MTPAIKSKIREIWDDHISLNGITRDSRGTIIVDIDAHRYMAIEEIKVNIAKFLHDEFNIHQFKTALDSYNKRNNLWVLRQPRARCFSTS